MSEIRDVSQANISSVASLFSRSDVENAVARDAGVDTIQQRSENADIASGKLFRNTESLTIRRPSLENGPRNAGARAGAHHNLVLDEPLEIQCGEETALLFVSKLCQGSKGPCILYRSEWLTPNELQYICGRETAKDWKRSIRHKGKSLKSLIAQGFLKVHPPICDCPGCRVSSPVVSDEYFTYV